MNYHIVRANELIEDIALLYNMDVYEIKECNKHIREWVNLTPGLKLRLPEISESLALELNDVEPFIEDFYPKLSPLYMEEKIEDHTEAFSSFKETKTKNNNFKNFNYYSYYNPYYNYYRYLYRNRKPR